MAEKKNQHYVPKFHLKFFSNNEDQKSIGVWHVDNEKYIPSASIKSQASEDYFYGKDLEIENAFGEFEGYIAELTKYLIEFGTPPQHYSPAHLDILAFIVTLAKRTKFAADEINEGTDKMMKSILKHDPNVKDHLDKVTISTPSASIQSLGHAMMSYPLTIDLKFKLLRNDTNQPFITSDHPVVLFNQFLQSRNWIGGRNGLAQVGLQIFYPVSPDYMLVFYDENVYKCGNRKDVTVSLNSIQDVDELNGLQLITCNEVLYFNETISEGYLQKLSKLNRKYRNNNKIDLKELKQIGGDPDDVRSLLWISSPHITKVPKFSVLKTLKKSRKRQLDPSMAQVRDKKAIDEHEKFVDRMLESMKKSE